MPYEKYLENDTISVESKAPFARLDFSAKMITQIDSDDGEASSDVQAGAA